MIVPRTKRRPLPSCPAWHGRGGSPVATVADRAPRPRCAGVPPAGRLPVPRRRSRGRSGRSGRLLEAPWRRPPGRRPRRTRSSSLRERGRRRRRGRARGARRAEGAPGATRRGAPPGRRRAARGPRRLRDRSSSASARSLTAARASTPAISTPAYGPPAAASSARWPPAEWPAMATRPRSRRLSASAGSARIACWTSSSEAGQPPPDPSLRYSTFQAAMPRRCRSQHTACISSRPNRARQKPPWIDTATGNGPPPSGR